MEFKDLVMQRYAAKEFSSERVPEEKIEELVDLIRYAPSALNLQPWRIRILGDRKDREALAPALFGQKHAVACSHLLIFCADTAIDGVIDRADQSMRESGVPDEKRTQRIAMARSLRDNLNLAWAQQQVFLALGNAVNGAKALGFDSCPITGFNPGECGKILGLPAHVVPTALCPVGYGVDTPLPKARLSREAILI